MTFDIMKAARCAVFNSMIRKLRAQYRLKDLKYFIPCTPEHAIEAMHEIIDDDIQEFGAPLLPQNAYVVCQILIGMKAGDFGSLENTNAVTLGEMAIKAIRPRRKS